MPVQIPILQTSRAIKIRPVKIPTADLKIIYHFYLRRDQVTLTLGSHVIVEHCWSLCY